MQIHTNKEHNLLQPYSSAFWAIVIFLVFLAALDYKLSLLPNSYSSKHQNLLKQSNKIECLVLGSSHSYFGIKPDELNVETFNLANTSQSLSEDLSLFKHYINKLPKLRFLIVPISYFSLAYNTLDSPESWRDCYDYHFLGACEANWWQRLSNPKYFSLFYLYGSSQVLDIIKHHFRISYASDTDTHGWFYGQYGSPVTPDNAVFRVNAAEESMKDKYYKDNYLLLRELVNLSISHNVRVLFVTLPVHKYYFTKMNATHWARSQEIIKSLCQQYNASYFNHMQDPQFSLDCFRDSDHLNQKGAILFTRLLNKELSGVSDHSSSKIVTSRPPPNNKLLNQE